MRKRQPKGEPIEEIRPKLKPAVLDGIYERSKELGALPGTSWAMRIEIIWRDYCSSKNIRAETK